MPAHLSNEEVRIFLLLLLRRSRPDDTVHSCALISSIIRTPTNYISTEQFFSSLSNLLSSTSQKSRGSVFLTQKPLPVSPAPAAAADASQEEPSRQQPQKPAILIRATDGNTNAPNPKTTTTTNKDSKSKTNNKKKDTTETPKVKISTIVAPEDLEAFYARYAEVCKAGMSGLKKRDRKKGKAKAKGGQAKVTKP